MKTIKGEIKFSKYKKQIEKAIKKKSGLDGNFTLVEGFITAYVEEELTIVPNIGGRTIPMVAVIDNYTGKMHQFSIMILLEGIEEIDS